MSEKTTYRVTGMTCGGCAAAVMRAMAAAAPAATVEVDHAADTVTVLGDVDAGLVRQTVEDAGFDFEGPIEAE